MGGGEAGVGSYIYVHVLLHVCSKKCECAFHDLFTLLKKRECVLHDSCTFSKNVNVYFTIHASFQKKKRERVLHHLFTFLKNM